MNAKSLAAGTVAGTVALFLAGYVLYELVFGGFYAANTDTTLARPEINMVTMTLSTIVYAFFLTFVFTRWAGIRTWQSGAVAAAIIGFLVALSVDLSIHSMYDMMETAAVVADPIIAAIWAGVGGAAIGFTIGKVS